MAAVKGSPPTRQEKAARTRRAMLDAAYELFCEHGFKGTTMDAVAKRAGVAVQTVYFTFHTKDALLQEVQDRAVIGDERVAPPDQPWYQEAVAAADGPTALAAIVRGTGAIEARIAPLIPVFHAVSSQPAGAVWRHAEALRRAGFGDLIDVLAAKTPLRKGLTRARAVDLLFVVLGPELYRSFVIDAGWSHDEWAAWVVASLCRDLFDAAPPRPKRGGSRRPR